MSFVNCLSRGGVCRLCLTEKLQLLKHFNDVNLLNKKSEFVSKCRHKNKLIIKSAENGMFLFYFASFVSFVIYLFVHFRNRIDT